MLALLSPSKTLDFESEIPIDTATQPEFLDEAESLVDRLRDYDIEGLRDLMDISEDLALLNYDRFQSFSTPFTAENARQAIFAYQGDVYRDFRLDEYGESEFEFLQDHVRILTGLYGVLRPFDLIQPYRLEMRTKLENSAGDDLYEFWGDKITDAVSVALDLQGDNVILNLASNEYYDTVDTDQIGARVVDVNFKDLRDDGSYRVITFYLKRLRGTMTDWVIRNQVTDPEDLIDFDERNYYFSEEHSSEDEYVFLRDEKP